MDHHLATRTKAENNRRANTATGEITPVCPNVALTIAYRPMLVVALQVSTEATIAGKVRGI